MERSWLRRAAPLLAVSAGLVGLSTAVLLLAYATGAVERGALPGGSLRWVDVNRERNLPTAWTTGLLLASAAVAGVVARRDRSGAWALVAAVLGLLAADEALQLHDRLGTLGAALGADRLTFPWVLPGLLLAVPTAAVMLYRLRREEPAVLRRLVLSGGLYVGGAAGFEVVSGAVLAAHGRAEAYVLATSAEEGLEMTGASLLLAALLGRLTSAARSRAASDAAPAVPGPRTPASTGHRPSRATPGA